MLSPPGTTVHCARAKPKAIARPATPEPSARTGPRAHAPPDAQCTPWLPRSASRGPSPCSTSEVPPPRGLPRLHLSAPKSARYCASACSLKAGFTCGPWARGAGMRGGWDLAGRGARTHAAPLESRAGPTLRTLPVMGSHPSGRRNSRMWGSGLQAHAAGRGGARVRVSSGLPKRQTAVRGAGQHPAPAAAPVDGVVLPPARLLHSDAAPLCI